MAIRAGNSAEEAETWYRRGLGLPGLDPPTEALLCNNLAGLIRNEVRSSRAPAARLSEARGYAERALSIREALDASPETWTTLNVLADIARLEGEENLAQDYSRRARQAFAGVQSNRELVNSAYGALIVTIARGALGDATALAEGQESLPAVEQDGWEITAAVRRIWAGERDWDLLVPDLDYNSALMVLRVLETIQQIGAFDRTFSEAERKQLGVLNLFQGVVSVDLWLAMGRPQAASYVPALRGLTRPAGLGLLDRAAAAGLLSALVGGAYMIQPTQRWYFGTLYARYYSSSSLPRAKGLARQAERAFTEVMALLSEYNMGLYAKGERDRSRSALQFEAANLMHAHQLALADGSRAPAAKIAQALELISESVGSAAGPQA
jgi:hypothetical protein